ncbi:molybdopterin cofactor-binding domain-containing protein [Asaia astilbis]|uniref:molybdopterin cofactor-binding domain-containing protein n=1 Tax=Asaia astilbis TaxID=610244 RepID=UPI000A42A8E2|nr:molybdopterin cofactor-binding domain-containing protein [Asaia astilbis]
MRKPYQIGPALNRRAVLRAALATGGGLILSGVIPGLPGAHAEPEGVFTPNAFIRIDREGAITFIMRHAEMGQGIYTGIAMLLAEELEVALDKVALEAAPADSRYIDKTAGEEVTGGSASTRDSWVPLRQAGAAARIMLVRAAAKRWSVPVESCEARDGAVLHPSSGRSLSYGALADDAARQPVPDPVPLKDPSQFRLIGTNPRRMDTRAKSNGSAVFGIDVRLDGMKIGRIMACPVRGGTLKGFDREAALKIPGVIEIVTLPDALAVIGDHSWAAFRE